MKDSIIDFIDYYSNFDNEVDNKTDDYFDIENTLKELGILKNDIHFYDHQLSCINYMLYKTLFKRTNRDTYMKKFMNQLLQEVMLPEKDYFTSRHYSVKTVDELFSKRITTDVIETNVGVLSSEIGSGKTLMTLTTCLFLKKILPMYDIPIKEFGKEYIKNNATVFRAINNGMDSHNIGVIDANIINTIGDYLPSNTKYYDIQMTKCDENVTTLNIKTPVVVIPHHLINQWTSEVKKFFNIDCLVYKNKRTKLTIEKINNADIVLINENSLNMFCESFDQPLSFDYLFFDEFDLIKRKNVKHSFKTNYTWFITTTYKRLCDRIEKRNLRNGMNIFDEFAKYYREEYSRLKSHLKKKYSKMTDFKEWFKHYFVVQSNIENIDILTGDDYKTEEHIIKYKHTAQIYRRYNFFNKNLLSLKTHKLFYSSNRFLLKTILEKIVQKLRRLYPDSMFFEDYIDEFCNDPKNEMYQNRFLDFSNGKRTKYAGFFLMILFLTKKYFLRKIELINKKLNTEELTDSQRNYYNESRNTYHGKIILIEDDIAELYNKIPDWFNYPVPYATGSLFDRYIYFVKPDYDMSGIIERLDHIYSIKNQDTWKTFYMKAFELKIRDLKPILKRITKDKNNRVIVFIENTECEQLIRPMMDKNKIPYIRVTGNNNVIKNKLKRYDSGEIKVILLNNESYSSGLDLPKTTHIILTSQLDNATKRQAIGRAKRIGKENAQDLTVISILDEMELM